MELQWTPYVAVSSGGAAEFQAVSPTDRAISFRILFSPKPVVISLARASAGEPRGLAQTLADTAARGVPPEPCVMFGRSGGTWPATS